MSEELERPILNYTSRDVGEALGHWLLMRAGRTVNNPNPVAEALLRSRDGHRGVDLAASITGRVVLRGQGYQSSLFEPSFGEAVAGGLQQAITEGFGAAEPLPFFQARALTTAPKAFPRASSPAMVEGESLDFGDFVLGSGETANTIQFRFFGAWVGISRMELVNDDYGGVMETVRQFGLSAGKLESRLFCEALESPDNLKDGDPLFGEGNTLTGDLSSLGEALALLKTTPLENGEPANLRGKWLICHPKQEAAAIEAVNKLTPSGQPPRLRVVGLPWLGSETTFYVLADPLESPVIARLTLLRSDGPGISFHANRADWTGRDGTKKAFFGLVFGARHWFGIGAIGRRGAVRVQAG